MTIKVFDKKSSWYVKVGLKENIQETSVVGNGVPVSWVGSVKHIFQIITLVLMIMISVISITCHLF